MICGFGGCPHHSHGYEEGNMVENDTCASIVLRPEQRSRLGKGQESGANVTLVVRSGKITCSDNVPP